MEPIWICGVLRGRERWDDALLRRLMKVRLLLVALVAAEGCATRSSCPVLPNRILRSRRHHYEKRQRVKCRSDGGAERPSLVAERTSTSSQIASPLPATRRHRRIEALG